jgi:hypothetical protein
MSSNQRENKSNPNIILRTIDGNITQNVQISSLKKLMDKILSSPEISENTKINAIHAVLKGYDLASSKIVFVEIKTMIPSKLAEIILTTHAENNFLNHLQNIANDTQTPEEFKKYIIINLLILKRPFYTSKILKNLATPETTPGAILLKTSLEKYLMELPLSKYFLNIVSNTMLTDAEKEQCLIYNLNQLDFEQLKTFYQSLSQLVIEPSLRKKIYNYFSERQLNEENSKVRKPENSDPKKRKREEKTPSDTPSELEKIRKWQASFSSQTDKEKPSAKKFIPGTEITNDDLIDCFQAYLPEDPLVLKSYLQTKTQNEIYDLISTVITPEHLQHREDEFNPNELARVDFDSIMEMMVFCREKDMLQVIINLLKPEQSKKLLNQIFDDVAEDCDEDSFTAETNPTLRFIKKIMEYIETSKPEDKTSSSSQNSKIKGINRRHLDQNSATGLVDLIKNILASTPISDSSKQNLIFMIFKSLSYNSVKIIHNLKSLQNAEILKQVQKRYAANPLEYTHPFSSTEGSISSSSSTSISTSNNLLLDVQEVLLEKNLDTLYKFAFISAILFNLPVNILNDFYNACSGLTTLDHEKELLKNIKDNIRLILRVFHENPNGLKEFSSYHKTIKESDLFKLALLIRYNRIKNLEELFQEASIKKIDDLIVTESDFFCGSALDELILTKNKVIILLILARVPYDYIQTIINRAKTLFSLQQEANPENEQFLEFLKNFIPENQGFLTNLYLLLDEKKTPAFAKELLDLTALQKFKAITTIIPTFNNKTLFQKLAEDGFEALALSIISTLDDSLKIELFEQYEKTHSTFIKRLRELSTKPKSLTPADMEEDRNPKRELREDEILAKSTPGPSTSEEIPPQSNNNADKERNKEREVKKPRSETKNHFDGLMIHGRAIKTAQIKTIIDKTMASKNVSNELKEKFIILLMQMSDLESAKIIFTFSNMLSTQISLNIWNKYLSERVKLEASSSSASFFNQHDFRHKSSLALNANDSDIFGFLQFTLNDHLTKTKEKADICTAILNACHDVFFLINIYRCKDLKVATAEKPLLNTLNKIMLNKFKSYLIQILKDNPPLHTKKWLIVNALNRLTYSDATNICSDLTNNPQMTEGLRSELELYLIGRLEKRDAPVKEHKAASNSQTQSSSSTTTSDKSSDVTIATMTPQIG